MHKKGEVLSDAELRQKSLAGQASRTHGAYAFRAHGEAALDATGRSRYAEVADLAQSRSGMLCLLQKRCVEKIMMCEILDAFIIKEYESGKSLNDIPALNKLPGHENTALRYILAWLKELPGDDAPANEELIKIQKVIDDDDKQNSE